VFLAALALLPTRATALPLLSEVLYDATGADNGLVFVEIYGAPGTVLDGLVIEGVNGSGGAIGPSIPLVGEIPLEGLFVVADDAGDGTTGVANADLVVDFDFQNGPDSILLRSGDIILDALGYGDFGAGDLFAGEGTPAPDAPAGSSLARLFADVDTDDNFADFVVLSEPTPGSATLAAVPEPGTATLLATSLGSLALLGGARGRKCSLGRRRSPDGSPGE
jgi:hypothetical protein